MTFERRRTKRFVIPDEEIVVMGLHSNCVGVLRNISMGGMKFEYMSETAGTDQWKMVDIMANRQVHAVVAGVSCSIAYDIKDMASNRTFTGLRVRICGVSFSALTAAQTAKLQNLLARQGVC